MSSEEGQKSAKRVINLRAVAAEFIAMTMFVIIGCGTAAGFGANAVSNRLVVALAFGIAIMVLAYSIGHHSGGQINCAVTFSLVLGGELPWYQGIANVLAQLIGSLSGAVLLACMVSCQDDLTTNLGTNIIAPGRAYASVLLAEAFGTFLLCFVVFETALSPLSSSGVNACLAIGFSVFLAHLLLLPMDGCSINPTRSFGPAVVSKLRGCSNFTEGGLSDLWVMFVGPLVGAAVAALLRTVFVPKLRRSGSVLKDHELAKGVAAGHADEAAVGSA